ncbi:MAG: prolyl-tRNA synthetase associated domain-containing protein [Dorea sp.]|nr:prolyl-tRNA synthetase associated domain-containing protein [Dorea sp.]
MKPENLENRLDRERRVYDLLDQLQIDYITVDHEAAFTMEACQEVDKQLGTAMCKNLFLCNRQKTQFYLLLLPGDKVFKTKNLSKQLGCARLSFAGPEFMEEYLDITPGSVSIMGLMNDKENHIQLVIDNDTAKEEYLGCHPCVNTSSMRLKTEDVLNVFCPAVGHVPVFVDLPWEKD